MEKFKKLSRAQMKNVKGGTPICDDGQIFDCICEDGTHICVLGDGVDTTADICNDGNICINNGGYYAGSACGFCQSPV